MKMALFFLQEERKILLSLQMVKMFHQKEIENKIEGQQACTKILVRDSEGVIEAEIYPDYEYAEKKGITDILAELQKL